MLDALTFATAVSVIVAVVLAVARDVPILELLLPPGGKFSDAAGILLGFPMLCCMALGFGWAAWCLALAYGWTWVGWNLWYGAEG